MPAITSYKYEPLGVGDGEGRANFEVGCAADWDEYEMDDTGACKLHEIDGVHDGLTCPSEEQLATLQRVGDAIPWNAYLIAIVELAERFSYYGTVVVFTNFIQYPLPLGSHTGAGLLNGQSGALGKGQHTSTGITTAYKIWYHITPFAGAYLADVHLGRFTTICLAVFIALVGHITLIFAAVPGIIEYPDTALPIFLVSLVVIGLGTGLFKANISPLVAEQYKHTKSFVVTTAGGEKVIVDPALTVSRIYMYFAVMVNLGALFGQFVMTYTEKYVGFWLAYALPTAVFVLCPIILVVGRKRYVRAPPTGSVVTTFMHLMRFACKGRWSANPVRTWRNLSAPGFWDAARPSRISPALRPAWMTFDDGWVDEVRRGLGACAVFVWFPIYWLTTNQMGNNLTSQAATMTTDGIPNDVMSNLNPLVLVLCIPLCDLWLYPALQRRRIRFTPLKRIAVGFLIAATAMVWAAVLQYNIYQTSPCGRAAATCRDAAGNPLVSPLSVWIQAPAYILIALSEIFTSVTGYEYAYTKAPKNMRSIVMAMYMGTGAMSAVLGEAFLWLSADPLLVWNYAVMAVFTGGGGCAFWLVMKRFDTQEDEVAVDAGRTVGDADENL
ncbi:peptide transporter PTR2A [Mycena capillaripes]|nr:peptide transporter PTR2A [Mycena capillaripes]